MTGPAVPLLLHRNTQSMLGNLLLLLLYLLLLLRRLLLDPRVHNEHVLLHLYHGREYLRTQRTRHSSLQRGLGLGMELAVVVEVDDVGEYFGAVRALETGF